MNKVEVKLVVFRPTKDEILIGKVEKCVPEGIVGNKSIFVSFMEIE